MAIATDSVKSFRYANLTPTCKNWCKGCYQKRNNYAWSTCFFGNSTSEHVHSSTWKQLHDDYSDVAVRQTEICMGTLPKDNIV